MAKPFSWPRNLREKKGGDRSWPHAPAPGGLNVIRFPRPTDMVAVACPALRWASPQRFGLYLSHASAHPGDKKSLASGVLLGTQLTGQLVPAGPRPFQVYPVL